MMLQEPLVKEVEFSRSVHCFLVLLIPKKTWPSLADPLASHQFVIINQGFFKAYDI